MAEGGYIQNSNDIGSESSSLFSVRRAEDDTSCITDDTFVSCRGKSDDRSDFMSVRGISEETINDNTTVSTVHSISTLSVKGEDDDTYASESDTLSLDDSFNSVKEAKENNCSNISKNRDKLNKLTHNKKEVMPEQKEYILYSRSNNKELLCQSCLQDDIKTKATHYCNSCDRHGLNMCYKCLRYHGKFTNHRDVSSLLTNTTIKSPASVDDRKETTVKEESLAHNNSVQSSKSCAKLEQYHLNIATDNDKKDCIAIDFAQMKNGNLIIADFVNKSLKIFYVENLQLKDVFYLRKGPLCITCFAKYDEIAIGYDDALCLEIFDECHRTLEIYRRHGECNGLKSVGQYLYSLDEEPGTASMSMYFLQREFPNLKLIKRIDLQQIGIVEPDQIDVDKFGETIFITDASYGIFILDKNGLVLEKITVNTPRGISFDGSNKVFVCCIDSGTVLEINLEEVEEKTILSGKHGIVMPCVVFRDRLKGRLFVGMHQNNYVIYTYIQD